MYENDLAGRISATELGFAEASDGKPLDPLTVYARRAAQFPPFAGESFDLETARRSITTPTLVVGGARDVIVPLWRSRLAAEIHARHLEEARKKAVSRSAAASRAKQAAYQSAKSRNIAANVAAKEGRGASR